MLPLPFPSPPRRRAPLARAVALGGLVVAAGLVSSAPSVAEAQTPPSLTAQSEAQARFQTGLKYYDARDFESARLAFTQAYAVLQKPAILLNLALSELYTNRPVEAIDHLDRYLAEPDLPADKRDRAKKAYDEAFKKVGHLAITVLPGTELRVDGVAITPPIPRLVHTAPGTRVLDATRGKGTRSVTVAAAAGETLEVDLKIEEGAVGPVAAGVATKVAAGAGAGAGEPVTPPVGSPPAEEDRTPTWRYALGIGGGAMVVAGAVGIVLGVGASSDADGFAERASVLTAQLPPGRAGCIGSSAAICAEADRATSDREDAKARSNNFLVGGGLLAVAGASLIAVAIFKPNKTSSVALRLAPGPSAAGLSLTSSY